MIIPAVSSLVFRRSAFFGFEAVKLRERGPDLLAPIPRFGFADQPRDRPDLALEKRRRVPEKNVDRGAHGVGPLARHAGEVLLDLPRDPAEEMPADQRAEDRHRDEEPEQLEV